LLSVESRQLTFVFADSPLGGEDNGPSDVSVGKSYLLLIADVKKADNSTTSPADPLDRLLGRFLSDNNVCLRCEIAT
jgi:hypothetical protein